MHPVIFTIGPLKVHSWGLCLAAAFAVGTVIAAARAKREGIPAQHVLDLSLWIVLGSLAGARILYILLDFDYYAANPPAVLGIGEGGLMGLSLHGGVLGALAVGALFTRRRKLPFFKLADIVAPSVALGTAIARIGCFLNGCCYGIETNLAWGTFTRYEPGLRHPTQIYEMALDLGLFAFLWHKSGRVPYPGVLFALYVAGYSIVRFVVEYWRVAERVSPSLTVAQAGSFVGIAFALGFALAARHCSGRRDREA